MLARLPSHHPGREESRHLLSLRCFPHLIVVCVALSVGRRARRVARGRGDDHGGRRRRCAGRVFHVGSGVVMVLPLLRGGHVQRRGVSSSRLRWGATVLVRLAPRLQERVPVVDGRGRGGLVSAATTTRSASFSFFFFVFRSSGSFASACFPLSEKKLEKKNKAKKERERGWTSVEKKAPPSLLLFFFRVFPP